jgi:hypothetical protein
MVNSARRCPRPEDTDASLALSFVLAGDASAACTLGNPLYL